MGFNPSLVVTGVDSSKLSAQPRIAALILCQPFFVPSQASSRNCPALDLNDGDDPETSVAVAPAVTGTGTSAAAAANSVNVVTVLVARTKACPSTSRTPPAIGPARGRAAPAVILPNVSASDCVWIWSLRPP